MSVVQHENFHINEIYIKVAFKKQLIWWKNTFHFRHVLNENGKNIAGNIVTGLFLENRALDVTFQMLCKLKYFFSGKNLLRCEAYHGFLHSIFKIDTLKEWKFLASMLVLLSACSATKIVSCFLWPPFTGRSKLSIEMAIKRRPEASKSSHKYRLCVWFYYGNDIQYIPAYVLTTVLSHRVTDIKLKWSN